MSHFETDSLGNIENPAIEVNALGQPCPMPLLMLKRSMKVSPDTTHFLLKASDANSQTDVSRYCQMHQLECHMKVLSSQEFHYLIHKTNK